MNELDGSSRWNIEWLTHGTGLEKDPGTEPSGYLRLEPLSGSHCRSSRSG
jgi:hypothetical protein